MLTIRLQMFRWFLLIRQDPKVLCSQSCSTTAPRPVQCFSAPNKTGPRPTGPAPSKEQWQWLGTVVLYGQEQSYQMAKSSANIQLGTMILHGTLSGPYHQYRGCSTNCCNVAIRFLNNGYFISVSIMVATHPLTGLMHAGHERSVWAV